jgi:N6-L-threonylcarbamoyladenine synthase
MKILAIETSCDETAAAVVQNGIEVLGSCIASSQEAFRSSGGVIPEEAARKQVECIVPNIEEVLKKSGTVRSDIDAIAVTKGPGLSGSLLVGSTAGRALASLWNTPLIGVHHTLGHLCSPWIACSPPPAFPVITLSASGGHSDMWYRTSHTRGKLLGSTRDDAAGEAFDKGAAMLGLTYPGGPSIQRAGSKGSRTAFTFPKPLHNEDGLDFSFSGLKTSLKYTIRDLPKDTPLADVLPNLAASYEHALCRHLVDRLLKATALYPDVQEVHIVGGVSANAHLRELIETSLPEVLVRYPVQITYCTDNAAMIGCAAHFLVEELGEAAYDPFTTESSLPLTGVIQG